MIYPRKPVCYRIGGGPCQKGYQNVDCGTGEVYLTAVATATLVGAVVVPCGDCPEEVVLSTAPALGLQCDETTAPVDVAGPIQTVPHPDFVQRVLICPQPGQFDREVSVWCDKNTNEAVTVVSYWPQDAVPGTPPVVETYTTAGLPWGGDVLKLEKCVDTVDPQTSTVCADGVPYTRTTFFDVETRLPTAVVWQDASGAIVAEPAGPLVVGDCPAVATSIKVAWLLVDASRPWSGEGAPPSSSITGAELVAMFGSLLSVTIKQTRGNGTLTGAVAPTGAVPFSLGESWSWSSHGQDQEDVLDPAFTLNAGSGAIRVIVTYRAP